MLSRWRRLALSPGKPGDGAGRVRRNRRCADRWEDAHKKTPGRPKFS
jgi:hypothetical protein